MSDDTSSHVRVSHLYDELLYQYAAITRKRCEIGYELVVRSRIHLSIGTKIGNFE